MGAKYGVSNLLIVESQNDKFFIQRLLNELQIIDTDIAPPFCRIDDYECMNGWSVKRLEKALFELKETVEKRGITQIGILVDADQEGIQKKLHKVNEAVKVLDEGLDITEPNLWYHIKILDLKVACHMTNVDGYGELETLLKTIKSEDSPFADCLGEWRSCLEAEGKTIKDKDFDKFWISIYQRFDSCKKREKNQADRKCSPEASMKKDIWDFEHEALDDLKVFLRMFQQ